MTNKGGRKDGDFGYRPQEEKGYKPESPAKLPPPTNPGPANEAPPSNTPKD